jgi:hypothetical protein
MGRDNLDNPRLVGLIQYACLQVVRMSVAATADPQGVFIAKVLSWLHLELSTDLRSLFPTLLVQLGAPFMLMVASRKG